MDKQQNGEHLGVDAPLIWQGPITRAKKGLGTTKAALDIMVDQMQTIRAALNIMAGQMQTLRALLDNMVEEEQGAQARTREPGKTAKNLEKRIARAILNHIAKKKAEGVADKPGTSMALIKHALPTVPPNIIEEALGKMLDDGKLKLIENWKQTPNTRCTSNLYCLTGETHG